MYYKIDSQMVSFNSDTVKLVQVIDPETGKPFISKTAQIKWVESTIGSIFNTIKITMTFLNEAGEEIKDIYTDTPCKLKFSTDFKNDCTVKVSLFTIDDILCKDIDLNFVNGEAIIDITFTLNGEYYLSFNKSIEIIEQVKVDNPSSIVDITTEDDSSIVIEPVLESPIESIADVVTTEPMKIELHILHELHEYKIFVAKNS